MEEKNELERRQEKEKSKIEQLEQERNNYKIGISIAESEIDEGNIEAVD